MSLPTWPSGFGTPGEPDSLGIMFSPTHAGLCRMELALETANPDRAVHLAQDIHPERHPLKDLDAALSRRSRVDETGGRRPLTSCCLGAG